MWWSSGRPRGRGSPARTSAAECSLRRAPAGAPAVAPLCRASAVALLCRASAVAGGAGMRQGERGLAVELAHLRQQLLLAEVLQLHRGADGRVRERGDHYAGEQADRHQQRERAHAADDDGVGGMSPFALLMPISLFACIMITALAYATVGSSVQLENLREEELLAQVRELHGEAALALPHPGSARHR